MEFNKKESIRYLGFHKNLPDEITDKMIDKVGNEMLKEVSPKSVYKKYPVLVFDDTVQIDNYIIDSKKLARHLRGCKYVYLFAATLGIAADNRIRFYSAISMSMAVVGQAVCAALIESYCDEIEDLIAKQEINDNMYLRPRFSPGYGDFSIDYQKELLPRLDAAKRIGIILTDTCLMLPTKSVSAVIGVTDSKDCNANRCKSCDNKECEFREEN